MLFRHRVALGPAMLPGAMFEELARAEPQSK
jgi:hypothetical protein